MFLIVSLGSDAMHWVTWWTLALCAGASVWVEGTVRLLYRQIRRIFDGVTIKNHKPRSIQDLVLSAVSRRREGT